MDSDFNAFIAQTRALNGQWIDERPLWNTVANSDAIRHFAYGIGDDNPLWVTPEYAARSTFGRQVAPPTFVFSVLYPVLHGAATRCALTYLISGIRCEWYLPVLEGDSLAARARQVDVLDAQDRGGRRTAFIDAETHYRNQRDEVVAMVRGTLACIDRRPQDMLLERSTYEYSARELGDIDTAIRAEIRTGNRCLEPFALEPGQSLPPIVRGPLTVGDLVCWHTAIGPPYRANVLGYRDCLEKPHIAVTVPGIGWPVRYSQQHEDPRLAAQRGMPAPFDNSLMRTAWLSTLITNWMGDDGQLCALAVDTSAPVIYGDTTWYRGTVVDRLQAGDATFLTVRITGNNQLGEITTSAEAIVRLPRFAADGRVLVRSAGRSLDRPDDADSDRPPANAKDQRPSGPRVHGLFVHRLFESHCGSNTNQRGIWFGERRWHYPHLNRVANIRALLLKQLDVAPGKVCAICLGRSLEFVATVLAVLKAGGAYLPLDSALPVARLRTMLMISGADYLILETANSSSFSGFPGRTVLLGDLQANDQAPDPGNPKDEPHPDNDAYLLFTSGSTGEPRAVCVSHRSLGVYLQSIRRPLGVKSNDVFLHTASFAFSASVRQLMLPLSLGASLVLADENSVRDPLALLGLMRSRGVTLWDTVPSSIQQLIDTLKALPRGARDKLLENAVRSVFTTGEALRWETAHQWRHELGHRAVLHNLYSQTETAGTVCVFRLPEGPYSRTGVVPLGTPVENTQVYLLDADLHTVPEGDVGEIFVGGERLASRYHADPALTASRFISTPSSLGSSGRLYRTGDLARRRADGALESLGRADDQIKIRGSRIRLGEVAEAVSQHPNIAASLVLARQESSDPAEIQLVAYLVARHKPAPNVGELRRFLARTLPEYMLPTHFVCLDAFPVNPNGKIDRHRLPAPAPSRAGLDGDYSAPADELEHTLAGIWRELMQVAVVGTRDNFFELGGHSLIVSRLRARVLESLGVDLPLGDFFEHPTIEEQARRIAAARPRDDSAARES